LALVTTSFAATINGDADGILHVPSEYPTLEVAWEELSNGDTIKFEPGTYVLDDIDHLTTEDMSVSLIGETYSDGSPAVILDGMMQGVEYISIKGDGKTQVTIEHLHLRHFSAENGGFGVSNCPLHIRNCIFEGAYNHSTSLSVGNVQGTIEDCHIFDNNAITIGGLGFMDREGYPPSNITVRNCVIENNYGAFVWGGGNGGVYFVLFTGSIGGTAHLVDCTITDNEGTNGGIDLSPQWDVTLTGNTVCSNETPGQIYGGTWTDGGSNCVQDACDDCDTCIGDLDDSGDVGVDDLLSLLAAYQQNGEGDCNDDGDTNVDDLLILISAWGDCP
jgi:hypothetical protein